MNATEAKVLATKLMNEHGLIASGWRFEFDNAKRRFGVCRYRRKVVGLSLPLVKLNSEAQVRDTILHEIAHALVGSGHGHGHVWKRKAIEIGCNGERCYSVTDVVAPQSKYQAICPSCGHIHRAHRIKKRKASCGLCSRTYNPNTLLNFQVVA